jgi:hypothetical protein
MFVAPLEIIKRAKADLLVVLSERWIPEHICSWLTNS